MITDGNLRRAPERHVERLADWLGRRCWRGVPLTPVERGLLDRSIARLAGEL